MRLLFLLIASLALFLGSCSSKGGGHAPPPLNKEWLVGKWKNVSTALFFSGCEFKEGGAVTITFQSMKQPVTGRYTWSGERTVDVEYPQEAEVREAYQTAAKEYKEDIKKRIESKDLDPKAGPSIMGMVPDKIPDKEALRVGISDPKFLILVRIEDGATWNFEKTD
jgi:hypothetical protein